MIRAEKHSSQPVPRPSCMDNDDSLNRTDFPESKHRWFRIPRSLLPFLIIIAASCRDSESTGIQIDPAGERHSSTQAPAPRKKILYIDSYHPEFAWVQGVTAGIRRNIDTNRFELEIIHLDTKRNQSEAFKKASALRAKAYIEQWKPDVVIASDDNASKYLIVPYFKGHEIPFVFCGINWDASPYGYPFRNVTGMIEVQLISEVKKQLAPYTKGPRIGFIRSKSLSGIKEVMHFERRLNTSIIKRFPTTVQQWKNDFLSLQKESDLLLMGAVVALKDLERNGSDLEEFVYKNAAIPIGAWDSYMKHYALITISHKAEEQGDWASQTAIRILNGESPENIPIATNHKARVFLNMPLAKKMGIKFPMNLIEQAEMLGERE